MPPVAGIALASSAIVNAPQSAKTPPATHAINIGPGPGSRSAMPAGDRKIPEPIVEPITTAIALQSPMRRWSDGTAAGSGATDDVIKRKYGAGLPAGSPSGDNSPMNATLNAAFLSVLFWICALAVVAAQAMILRSTVRAWRLGAARKVGTEWAFAVVPVVALAGVLWLSWAARS